MPKFEFPDARRAGVIKLRRDRTVHAVVVRLILNYIKHAGINVYAITLVLCNGC